jgi:hypothetical protein
MQDTRLVDVQVAEERTLGIESIGNGKTVSDVTAINDLERLGLVSELKKIHNYGFKIQNFSCCLQVSVLR